MDYVFRMMMATTVVAKLGISDSIVKMVKKIKFYKCFENEFEFKTRNFKLNNIFKK